MNIIGVDLGGTQLRIRLCDEVGTTQAERKMVLTDRTPTAVVSNIVELTQEMLVETAVDSGTLLVSCAVAGMLDAQGQVVRNAPNLQWREVPLAAMIREQLPYAQQVVLWNDLDAASWGEYVSGIGQGVEDVAAVFVGSGVGGGIILGGKPLRGSSGVAGEIGHLKVQREGRACGCGGFGCVEAYAGGHALTRLAQDYVTQNNSPFLQERSAQIGFDKLSAADLALGVQVGDESCVFLLQQAADALGLAISHLITLVNPACLILGGGVLLHWPALQQRVHERILHYTSTPAGEAIQIALSQLGNDAGMVGAVHLALHSLHTTSGL